MKNLINPEVLRPIVTKNIESVGGAFTIKSKITGKDYTFKIARTEFNKKFYTHVRVEVGYLNFVHLGTFTGGVITKKQVKVNGEAAEAAGWLLRQLQSNQIDKINDNVEIMHLGNCIKCGRELSDATSIEIGIGPTCRGHIK